MNGQKERKGEEELLAPIHFRRFADRLGPCSKWNQQPDECMALLLSSRRVNIILDREKRRLLYKFLGKSRAHHEYWSGGWRFGSRLIDWAERSVMERKDALPNEVTRKEEGTWEEKREDRLPQRNLISKWIGQQFLPLSRSLSTFFLINSFLQWWHYRGSQSIRQREKEEEIQSFCSENDVWSLEVLSAVGKNREKVKIT